MSPYRTPAAPTPEPMPREPWPRAAKVHLIFSAPFWVLSACLQVIAGHSGLALLSTGVSAFYVWSAFTLRRIEARRRARATGEQP